MLVLVQFPIVDGRVFARDSGVVDRPDWGTPRVSPLRAHREFVRGFGRVAFDPRAVNPAWADEAVFVRARRAVHFPTLQRRHFAGRDGGRWMVSLRSRRLLSDGGAAARFEIGFTVTRDPARGPISPAEVVGRLLALPAIVPGGRPEAEKELVLLGSSLARRYALATTRHGRDVAATLVAAGDPVVIAETPWDDDGAAAPAGRPLRLASTPTRHGGIATWYLRVGMPRPEAPRRNVRAAILHQHLQEETLDRVLRWVATGALEYVPQSPDGDRLEDYINTATKVVNRESYLGVKGADLRAALDAVASGQRAVEVRRRARLDGMRRQVRAKAERFLAERDAKRPSVNVSGRVVQVGDQIFSGQFYGPVAGTVYAERMRDSFNNFAAARPDDELQARVGELHERVADLVARLKEAAPDDAGEVAGTLATFTDELAKEKPNRTTLKALGRGIADAAKKVADVTTPVATAVSAVLKLFGIAAL
ncbi:hypothetical protein [Jiangella alkaliphila]|uniref:Uncharacterized protein n=1 Tax=Jiangella alkaliphila TaxID=419479 RepID=A0A1H2K129_9ACTN|nr:hypothetical protein [Jiangella alkaliphila]SDU62414.1 hypothetical protein SAMN04488563_3306 [Jiangella alkaliphila]